MILAFVVGAATGGALFMLGFFVGTRVKPSETEKTPEPQLTDKEKEQLKQWDNLMSFTGRPQ